jgi:hypothetical protein
MIETARAISREPGTYWVNQLENTDIIPGYYGLGEEIWTQTGGRVDAFVHGVGTAASSRGVVTVLKRHRSDLKFFAFEPAESPVLGGGKPGAHMVEGVGVGFVPALWDASLADGVIPVATEDAKEMARRLAREEALFAGTSSGANVIAAIRSAVARPRRHGCDLMIDSGLKYVNTDVPPRLKIPSGHHVQFRSAADLIKRDGEIHKYLAPSLMAFTKSWVKSTRYGGKYSSSIKESLPLLLLQRVIESVTTFLKDDLEIFAILSSFCPRVRTTVMSILKSAPCAWWTCAATKLPLAVQRPLTRSTAT